MKNDTPVPVLMYHSVGIPDPDWQWRYLTCPYDVFEDQMKWLKRTGFVSVSLGDLYEYIFNGRKLPRKSFIMTFDDGYADNWIFAYPIMKRYGFKGTVFINPEFADTRDLVRTRFDEEGPEAAFGPRDIRGFLSWGEMAEAEKDGVLDIQAHAMTHTWYPISERIIDFRHPGDSYIWMTWNDNREKKPYLQVDDEDLIKWGAPVYEHEKSLSCRRYFPNEEVAVRVQTYVMDNGGKDFFQKPGWREILFEKAESISEVLPPGRYESEDEYRDRVRRELEESKRIIEDALDKTVGFLCWPGGSCSETGLALAKDLGFKMTTTARDIQPAVRRKLSNRPSQRSGRIARRPPFLFWDNKETADSRIVYHSGITLLLSFIVYKRIGLSHVWGRVILKCLKEFRKFF